jgi:hypothetical protein
LSPSDIMEMRATTTTKHTIRKATNRIAKPVLDFFIGFLLYLHTYQYIDRAIP